MSSTSFMYVWLAQVCEVLVLLFLPMKGMSSLMQVRQLQATGFAIRRDILAEVDTANKFYRHGLLLKQVVNFYNNSATEIIPCQKPMLLQVQLVILKVYSTSLYVKCRSRSCTDSHRYCDDVTLW